MNEQKQALIIIDMQKGFVCPGSALCIENAAATIPAIAACAAAARENGIPVFFVKREYRPDGCDVERTRYKTWNENGRPLRPSSAGNDSDEFLPGLMPGDGDYIIVKRRWSAFFATELDLILRRLGVGTVVLTGTTTPNCIRTSCYDANALDYDVCVITDGTSSRTDEIQRVNLEDMQRMGAKLMTSREYIDSLTDRKG